MKKIIASAGLVAVGASGLQAAYAPGLTPMEASKPWSIAASVRGFYDDNYNTAPANNPSFPKRDSFGFEISPSARINIPLDQTFLGASFVYNARYYEDRPENNWDHSIEATLKADHKFSERYKINFEDSFAYSREPEVISGAGTPSATFIRTDSDVIRNRVRTDLTAQLTELLSIEPGYQLTWYDYLDSGAGSRSALLDRLEHLFHIDGRYQVQEHLVALLGYQYGVMDYTSSELLDPAGTLTGDSRDSTSHYFYGGADYAISSLLNVSGKVGVQYTKYDTLGGEDWSPYFDFSGTYTYLQNSTFQLGVRHNRNATDQGGKTTADIVKDQESTTVYASVNHRVSREITASLISQYQRGVFNGGSLDGNIDQFFMMGVNLEYRLNPNWAVEAGYNFDRLYSDIEPDVRSFTRNRVYVGASATF